MQVNATIQGVLASSFNVKNELEIETLLKCSLQYAIDKPIDIEYQKNDGGVARFNSMLIDNAVCCIENNRHLRPFNVSEFYFKADSVCSFDFSVCDPTVCKGKPLRSFKVSLKLFI